MLPIATTITPSALFTKSSRLLKGSEFTALKGAKIGVSDQYFLLFAKLNDLSNPRLGLAVAKRNVKLAVGRNTIKRIARESFRHSTINLPNIDIILLTRPAIAVLTKTELRQCLDKLWLQLAKRVYSSSRQL